MAIEADRVVVALIGDTSNLDSNVNGAERNFTRAMSSIERSASSAERQIVQSSGASAAAARNLGFQLSDIGTQLSGGQSPFLIIAQQGPQVSQALQEISASGAGLGQVLKTVALPGFLSILGILGPFVAQLLAGANAADTKRDATRALTDAINDMVKASDAAIASGTREIQISQGIANAKLEEARAVREATKARIQDRISALSSARTDPILGPGGDPSGRINTIEKQLAQARRDLAAAESREAQARVAVRNVETRAAQQRVRERTDPVAAAQGRFERGEIRLNNLRRAGVLSVQQYEAELTKLTETQKREVAAATSSGRATGAKTTAQRSATTASRDAEKAARDQTRELDQLRGKLNSIERQYDPTAAASREFADDLATIAQAMENGIITPARAAELRLKALEAQLQSWLSAARGAEEALGTAGMFDATARGIDQDRDRAAENVERERQRNAENQIYDLADLYETLFTDGTANLWDEFKRQGLRALSLLAAQKTFEAITGQALSLGGSGGGTGLFGSLLGGIFGRASGGYVAPGQTVRVNEQRGGVELLRMGGQGGSIIPLGRTDAARPTSAPTIVSAPQFNLKGAVVTRELFAEMERISRKNAAQASAAMGKQVLQAVPGRLSQYQRDEG